MIKIKQIISAFLISAIAMNSAFAIGNNNPYDAHVNNSTIQITTQHVIKNKQNLNELETLKNTINKLKELSSTELSVNKNDLLKINNLINNISSDIDYLYDNKKISENEKNELINEMFNVIKDFNIKLAEKNMEIDNKTAFSLALKFNDFSNISASSANFYIVTLQKFMADAKHPSDFKEIQSTLNKMVKDIKNNNNLTKEEKTSFVENAEILSNIIAKKLIQLNLKNIQPKL